MSELWRRTSFISVIYHFVRMLRGLVNMWPAFAGIAAVDSAREVFLQYGFAAVAVVLIISAYLQYHFYFYQLANGEIRIRQGVIDRKRLTLQLDRVQEINLQQSIYFRLFKLWTVSIESAGSASKEIEIPGISYENAALLKDALATHHRAIRPEQEEKAELPSDDPLETADVQFGLHMGWKDLARAGLMHNAFFYPAAFVGGAIASNETIRGYVAGWFNQHPIIENLFSAAVGLGGWSRVLAFSAMLCAVLGTVYLLSILISVFKYWKYNLQVRQDHFQYHSGLLDRQLRGFRAHKLQVFQVSQSMFARLLKRYSVIIRQTNDGNAKASSGRVSSFEIPVVTSTELNDLQALVGVEALDLKRVQFAKAAWGAGFWILCAVIATLVVLSLGVPFPFYYIPAVFVLASIHSYLRWRTERYALGKSWLCIKRGVLGYTITYVPYIKVQKIKLSESPIYRATDACGISLWNGSNLQRIKFVDRATIAPAAQHLIRTVSAYKGRWM